MCIDLLQSYCCHRETSLGGESFSTSKEYSIYALVFFGTLRQGYKIYKQPNKPVQ
jgi:hypothetical protein